MVVPSARSVAAFSLTLGNANDVLEDLALLIHWKVLAVSA
jgi:hypothetical protein